MTWALEEAVATFQQEQARRWLKRGGLRGGVSAATRVARRRWRRAGREICQLALQGDLERAEALDPQPRRLGVMWDIWSQMGAAMGAAPALLYGPSPAPPAAPPRTPETPPGPGY